MCVDPQPVEEVPEEVEDPGGLDLGLSAKGLEHLSDLGQDVLHEVIALALVRMRVGEAGVDPDVCHELVVRVLPILVVGFIDHLEGDPATCKRKRRDVGTKEEPVPVELNEMLRILVLADRGDEEEPELVLLEEPPLGAVQARGLRDFDMEAQERVQHLLHPGVELDLPVLARELGVTKRLQRLGLGLALALSRLVLCNQVAQIRPEESMGIVDQELTDLHREREVTKEPRHAIAAGLVDLIDQLLQPVGNRESHLFLQP